MVDASQSFTSGETAFQVLQEFALVLRVYGRDVQGNTEVLTLQRAERSEGVTT